MNDDNQRLSGSLQTNVITVLCFDAKYASLIRAAIKPQLFESKILQDIVGVAVDYLDRYKQPIGEHLIDHFEGIIEDKNNKAGSSYVRMIESLFQNRETVNPEFVLATLTKFVRIQIYKDAIGKAADLLTSDKIDEAEQVMEKARAFQIVTFEKGHDIRDADSIMDIFDDSERPFSTGIEALDRFEIGPAPKTLFLLNGAFGSGKSWGLMHLGMAAWKQRKCVLHLTFEMSDKKVRSRYMQMMHLITRREGGAVVPRMIKDPDGTFVIEYPHENLPSMRDANIKERVHRLVHRSASRKPFIVKEFPTGRCTLAMLDAYLDGLERFHNVKPDMIIIDYAELMFLDPGDRRVAIGQTFVGLRGIGVERNIAMVTAGQLNRGGIEADTAKATHMADDISKGYTVDTMVTYNQTEEEYRLGLARLSVDKAREEAKGMSIVITQAYAAGQFAIDSHVMDMGYLDKLNKRNRRDDDDEEFDRKTRNAERDRSAPRRTVSRRS